MGEYATYNGRSIKIGTCENMTGLTAAQAPLVTKAANSLDPIRDAESIRFRFPFPDEDGRSPGQPADFDRSVKVPGLPVWTAEEGHHYTFTGKDCSTAVVAITQQKVVDGLLALVVECSECGARVRLPTLADAVDVLAALYVAAEADPDGASFSVMAERIMDGYVCPPEWVAARVSKQPAA